MASLPPRIFMARRLSVRAVPTQGALRNGWRNHGAAASTASNAGIFEGRIVGFEAGDSQRPRVQLESGEYVTAVPSPKAFLSFHQRVRLQQLPGGIFRLEVPELAQEVEKPRSRLPFSPGRYDAITRGPNNVGAYAWVSRRMRSAKSARLTSKPE
eukprot:CAMPEP_0181433548 /NCGR_PEP_ID=MMETSP1110-20121109/19352_1 /TAXON_ID=174948 /ORGANISM="Symbiodinium sp., Strain CCMP421" /LENGTH=154 /DNA_ID=CAMNT_0023557011 /DNA_START=67 /DNA_END=528 /DNA_ORIENTATION=-